jgi:hypothetical protein
MQSFLTGMVLLSIERDAAHSSRVGKYWVAPFGPFFRMRPAWDRGGESALSVSFPCGSGMSPIVFGVICPASTAILSLRRTRARDFEPLIAWGNHLTHADALHSECLGEIQWPT